MKKANTKNFLTQEEKNRLREAIRDAEKQTSGEICVHLDSKGKGDVLHRAKKAFEKLGMIKTKHRNGVLIYLSLSDQAFAVVGDEGIHAQVGDQFWKEITLKMAHAFSQNNFADGIIEAINWLGVHLKKYFPREAGDVNELSDRIT